MDARDELMNRRIEEAKAGKSNPANAAEKMIAVSTVTQKDTIQIPKKKPKKETIPLYAKIEAMVGWKFKYKVEREEVSQYDTIEALVKAWVSDVSDEEALAFKEQAESNKQK